MAQVEVHLTNQVIPREVLEQWEGEADASFMQDGWGPNPGQNT